VLLANAVGDVALLRSVGYMDRKFADS